ncbi:Bifunctional protein Aas [Aquicella siphonis]|uniref:Bifunctional protein Aas n=1 Tax=Aquicella siphonis TaxID=254247 RepID=A0A5E4PJ59_9COXI|nr:acyl-[ACP]--phospholipid O-acyltransferase [Aquicella siphonis]VVC77050.1 Bifunctional protein Aas [Aquicella siphonis]
MAINQFNLLKINRFLPLFLTQFLGALNDNLFKNALVILIIYHPVMYSKMNAGVLTTLAAGVFILPFFLFSATAGQLADKYEKAGLIRYTKLAEIGIMLLACAGFYLQDTILLISVLFLLGTQAAIFGPLKYSILPDHLHADELVAGNALLESGTFLAILLGTILGGMLAYLRIGPTLVSIASLVIAIAGYAASLSIPLAKRNAPYIKMSRNIINESWKMLRHTFSSQDLSLAVLGISWFWLIGATYLSQFPVYVKNVLNAQSSVVTLFLFCFTAGIGIGSLVCNRMLKGRIHATYVPLAALGMTLFGVDLYLASLQIKSNSIAPITCLEFLSHVSHYRILIDLLLLSMCGGIYIVPLYAILQHESDPEHRSRAIASNNIMNALFMVAASLATSLMLFLNFSIITVFLIIAVANFFAAVYICNLLPEALIKSFLIWLLKSLYRVEIKGMDNYYQAGNRVLIIANHTSFLDAALLATFLPDRLTFAINTNVAKTWWIRIMMKYVNTYTIDPTNPLAAKSLIEYLRHNHRVVIFPEGRITVTGALMKIYEGPGLIADKAEAKILPIRINGAQYTPFSYLRGKVKIHWFPKITMTILEPRSIDSPESRTSRDRRQLFSSKLYDMMSDMIFLSSNTIETLFLSLLNAAEVHGARTKILEDIERKPISYKQLILASIVLGKALAKTTKQDECLGILLPNSIGNVVTFFAMQAYHRIPAMINFTSGLQNCLLACRTANIGKVYTSRKFLELAGLQHLADSLSSHGIQIIYLEDVRSQLGTLNKLSGKLAAMFPRFYYHAVNGIKKENLQTFASKPAVVLFTSGSEGAPKGVVLSHQNIQANRFQLIARVDFNPSDKVFNALPMFHSFGLTSATLLPIISGMRVFMYPSPLHYRIVPELCYDTNATIFFGTDTFLSNYAKYAHPYNFYSMRYVFAGAEKLRDETRKIWMRKFGIRIMEGYGVTEASPVLSANTPMQYKIGTVGRLLPGIRYQLLPVEGIQKGYRLLVAGPNIMMGYLFSHAPGVISAPDDGWHDTGDIVDFDEEGYITILGRAKRFAKIAGEMVSLTAVEEVIHALWPQYQHAVIHMPDDRKGEQIILVTNYKTAQVSQLIDHFRQQGMAELSLPKKILVLAALPVMGSGKVDYMAVRALVDAQYVTESCQDD